MNPEQIPLRDLHLPEAIDWWPPAPGWWLLAALLMLALGYRLFRAWQAWQRNAARRAALAELPRVQQAWQAERNVTSLGTRLSELLRRAMIAYVPRHEVAGLTGGRWLEWLDRGLDDRPFSAGPGRVIADLPYRHPAATADDLDVDRLLDAVRRRLTTPVPEYG
ncbi:MAG: DUF4381 domain-containing protein [Woeseia sp.]